MFTGIDVFSDTLSKPTLAMRKAILNAEVGDEQKGEDPTTRQLEELIAHMLGFDSALFFPSATMANEIAIRALCSPGDELFAAGNCHLFRSEVGGPAILANVMCRPIYTDSGKFTAAELAHHHEDLQGVHNPRAKLISVENTTNMGGGIPWSLAELSNIISYAKQFKLKTHMDGARFFNAHIATGLKPQNIAKDFDMVTICLSKGLGCPVGALLVFNKEYYDNVRRLKQLMGGAMRQSGIIAAAGIYALQHHINRLQDDHDNARLLASGLSEIADIHVINNPPATNIILFDWLSSKISANEFSQRCIEKGVRFSQVGKNRLRAVTHLGIMREDIMRLNKIVKEVVTGM